MLARRSPKLTLILTVSDMMAKGAFHIAKKMEWINGEDVLSWVIDWAQDVLEAIEYWDHFVSIRGYFLETEWTVVLICDYLSLSDLAKIKLHWQS